MKIRAIILGWIVVVCLGIPRKGLSQGYFELTDGVRAAYTSVSNLRIEEAKLRIATVKKEEPDNMLIYHIENYIDFFDLFINEEKDVYDRIKKNKDKRLDKIRGGDQSSPYYLFSQAEIQLQWATARLKFGEKIHPMAEVYRAYSLLERNQELFPDFKPNKKSLSIIHALAENLPGVARALFGVEGSIEKGTREISDLVAYSDTDPDFIWREECYAIYAYILFYQNNKRTEAYEMLASAELDIASSPLLCFLMANIAQKTGHNDEAIAILEARPKGAEYMPFYYLDFMYGKFLLYKQDEAAVKHIKQFTDHFKGRHYLKEAYQKLAWHALVEHNDVAEYKRYMALCDTEGQSLVDEDKQARREADDKKVPNTTLLRARLLYDGGYYPQAYRLLVLQAHLYVQDEAAQLEFNYRMGRIAQALGNLSDAIDYYLLTIDQGEDQDSYFACNSALQVGLILEDQGEYAKSKQLFERCLEIDSREYEASLHQKAASGLERVEKQMKKN